MNAAHVDNDKVIKKVLPTADYKAKRIRYPKLLSEIPIFVPTDDRELYTTLADKGIRHYVEGGYVERIGPGLNIFDQDTLIALLHIVPKHKIAGPPHLLPIPLLPTDMLADSGLMSGSSTPKEIVVLSGETTAMMINRFLSRGDGGDALAATRASVHRLALTRLVFANDGFGENDLIDGFEGITDFFRYSGKRDYRGNIIIQFSPEIVSLLDHYSHLDLSVRWSLGDVGKAVHMFLSSYQESSISLNDLKDAIGYKGPMADLKRSLLGRKGKSNRTGQLDIMVDCMFINKFWITGSGRNIPYELHIEKPLPE